MLKGILRVHASISKLLYAGTVVASKIFKFKVTQVHLENASYDRALASPSKIQKLIDCSCKHHHAGLASRE